MALWQIGLMLLASIVVGVAFGALLSYLISQFSKKREVMQMVQLIIDEAKERTNKELELQDGEAVRQYSQIEK